MELDVKLRHCLHEKGEDGKSTGSWSFSRVLPGLLFAVLITLGIAAVVFTAVPQDTGLQVAWSQVEGPLDWLRDLAFASILPYLTNRATGAMKRG